jgi:hypothetical protein
MIVAPPALAACEGAVGDPLEEQEAAMAQSAVRNAIEHSLLTGTVCLLRKMSGRLFKIQTIAVGFTRAQQLKRRCLLGERRFASLFGVLQATQVPPRRTFGA